MKISGKNSPESSLERVSEKNEISVYSVNFTQVINHHTEKELIGKSFQKDNPEEKASRSMFSHKLFRWQGAIAIAVILTVAALHFTFQFSFILSEKSENNRADGLPVKIEQLHQKPLEIKPAEVEAKTKDVTTLKPSPPIKQSRIKNAPVKPQPKKKNPVETRAERLRRAEKILTGV